MFRRRRFHKRSYGFRAVGRPASRVRSMKRYSYARRGGIRF